MIATVVGGLMPFGVRSLPDRFVYLYFSRHVGLHSLACLLNRLNIEPQMIHSIIGCCAAGLSYPILRQAGPQ